MRVVLTLRFVRVNGERQLRKTNTLETTRGHCGQGSFLAFSGTARSGLYLLWALSGPAVLGLASGYFLRYANLMVSVLPPLLPMCECVCSACVHRPLQGVCEWRREAVVSQEFHCVWMILRGRCVVRSMRRTAA